MASRHDHAMMIKVLASWAGKGESLAGRSCWQGFLCGSFVLVLRTSFTNDKEYVHHGLALVQYTDEGKTESGREAM